MIPSQNLPREEVQLYLESKFPIGSLILPLSETKKTATGNQPPRFFYKENPLTYKNIPPFNFAFNDKEPFTILQIDNDIELCVNKQGNYFYKYKICFKIIQFDNVGWLKYTISSLNSWSVFKILEERIKIHRNNSKEVKNE